MMKKFFATLLCLALVAGLFAACSGSKDDSAKTDGKKVGIAVLSENGAFTDMRAGIESKLKEKYGDNVTCVYKNAAGDAASLSTIVSDFDNGDYDAVFTGHPGVCEPGVRDPLLFLRRVRPGSRQGHDCPGHPGQERHRYFQRHSRV